MLDVCWITSKMYFQFSIDKPALSPVLIYFYFGFVYSKLHKTVGETVLSV